MTHWSARGLVSRVNGFTLGPLDLELAEGSAVAVLGRTGAGKTTLLRSLAGFIPVSAGSFERDGRDCSSWPPEARNLGYVPQGLGLFPHRNVEKNLKFPGEVRGRPGGSRALDGLVEQFGLSGLLRRFPSELSTGEQQRVALARALAADASLLLWDEPLSAMDVATRDELLGVLRWVRDQRRTPILFVTHDPTAAFSLADRFLLLDAGRSAFCGPPAGLLSSPVDRFAARFVGYENVLEPTELCGAQPFAGWLHGHAGPQGLAFPAVAVDLDRPSDGAWRARLERVEPHPDGWRLWGTVDGIAIRFSAPPDHGRVPLAGDDIRFDLSDERLRPLGGRPAPAEARS
jgi:ABC-type Fe3+/spermidine/putrescine transport system ATPase subunit